MTLGPSACTITQASIRRKKGEGGYSENGRGQKIKSGGVLWRGPEQQKLTRNFM